MTTLRSWIVRQYDDSLLPWYAGRAKSEIGHSGRGCQARGPAANVAAQCTHSCRIPSIVAHGCRKKGNASAGIRKMLRRYQELPPAIRVQLLAE